MGSTKTCFKCGNNLILSEFYKHSGMKDGHLNKCKECTKNDVSKHRLENIERVRHYDKSRKNKADRYKENAEREKRRRLEGLSYKKAHCAVFRAIKKGILIRECCQWCGRDTNVHAHHDDYSKPLDVMWLCPPCHRKRHYELAAMNKDIF